MPETEKNVDILPPPPNDFNKKDSLDWLRRVFKARCPELLGHIPPTYETFEAARSTLGKKQAIFARGTLTYSGEMPKNICPDELMIDWLGSKPVERQDLDDRLASQASDRLKTLEFLSCMAELGFDPLKAKADYFFQRHIPHRYRTFVMSMGDRLLIQGVNMDMGYRGVSAYPATISLIADPEYLGYLNDDDPIIVSGLGLYRAIRKYTPELAAQDIHLEIVNDSTVSDQPRLVQIRRLPETGPHKLYEINNRETLFQLLNPLVRENDNNYCVVQPEQNLSNTGGNPSVFFIKWNDQRFNEMTVGAVRLLVLGLSTYAKILDHPIFSFITRVLRFGGKVALLNNHLYGDETVLADIENYMNLVDSRGKPITFKR